MTTYRINATLGDLFIGGQDSSGAEIGLSGLTGWYAGSGARTAFQDKPAQHGADDAAVFRTARVVTLNGWVWATDRQVVANGLKRVTGQLAEGQLSLLTVNDPEYGSMSTWVRLSAEPEVSWDSPHLAKWQLIVTAPDPRLYGPDRIRSISLPGRGDAPGLLEPLTEPLADGWNPSLTGEVTIENPGTAALWPRLRVVGPAVNPRIWSPDTGAELRLRLTVPAGQFVDVLCKDRRVLAQGVASRRYAVSYTGDWLAIPAGGASLRWEADIYEPDAQLFVWAPEGAWL